MDKDIEHKSEISNGEQEFILFYWATKVAGDFYDIDYRKCKNIILDSIRISAVDKDNKFVLIPFDVKVGGKSGCRIIPASPAKAYIMSCQCATMGYKTKMSNGYSYWRI